MAFPVMKQILNNTLYIMIGRYLTAFPVMLRARSFVSTASSCVVLAYATTLAL